MNIDHGPEAERCCACGSVRPLVELLRMERIDRPDLAARFVCRPDRGTPCFLTAGPAARERITLAASPEAVRARDAALVEARSDPRRASGSAPVRSPESYRGVSPTRARRTTPGPS